MKKSFDDLINQNIPVLIDFYADWCGPCKSMAPILKQLKAELKDSISIIKINVDTNPALAAKYQVRGVPTFMVFKQGKQICRQSGMQSVSQLKQQGKQIWRQSGMQSVSQLKQALSSK